MVSLHPARSKSINLQSTLIRKILIYAFNSVSITHTSAITVMPIVLAFEKSRGLANSTTPLIAFTANVPSVYIRDEKILFGTRFLLVSLTYW